MWLLIPVGLTVAGLAGTIAYRKKVLKKGVLTPERRLVFTEAMSKILDPEKLRELAARFESEGLKRQAQILRKRAKLRSLPPEVENRRREIYRKALTLKDPKKVEEIAKDFENEGATGAAAELRSYANVLRSNHHD